MPQFQNFSGDDQITETTKVTTGYFTGDIGTVVGSGFVTSSLTSDQKEYYYTLQNTSADQFSVSFGNINGSGSDDTVGQTKAIYKQFSNLLLFPDDIETNGFQFSGPATEENVYFFVGERARMKDRINRKNWTLNLSGSLPVGQLQLTDDSSTITPTATPVGPRYNVVSGALGTATVTAAVKTYGWFYPNVGILALSEDALSSSIGEFAVDEATTADNAINFVHAITGSTAGITMRSEEDQITTSYFVRAKARDWNFSNNPTFGSGSDYTFAIREFTGNPQTFITTIGLYDNASTLVAVGRLSTPVLKNFSTEMTAKVNLVY